MLPSYVGIMINHYKDPYRKKRSTETRKRQDIRSVQDWFMTWIDRKELSELFEGDDCFYPWKFIKKKIWWNPHLIDVRCDDLGWKTTHLLAKLTIYIDLSILCAVQAQDF